MKKSKNSYLKALIKKYPNISSGRKNYSDHQKRIDEILKQINIYKKNKKNE